jgi:surface protein
MDNTYIEEEQFQLTQSTIDRRRKELEQLEFEELKEISRSLMNQVPQETVRRTSRTLKREMIESIIQHTIFNHNLVTEERFQFVEWLYRIRAQHGNHYGFLQPDFICIIFGKMMVSKLQRSDGDIKIAVNAWCEDPVTATIKYGHIGKWNTSLVTNMKELFKCKSGFNDDISKWDVSSVTDMGYMFWNTPFNGDISGWTVSSVTSMGFMFSNSQFNGDLSGWDVSSVTNMSCMFSYTPFDGDISGWDVSSVTNMGAIFGNTPFNGDISGWNVSSVTSMGGMFCDTPFDGDISGWNVSNVTNMEYMFYGGYGSTGSFNGDISGWNVSSVTNMGGMFWSTPFNGISLDGMSAVLLTWVTCSIRHPLMGISLDGMSAVLLTCIPCSKVVLFLKIISHFIRRCSSNSLYCTVLDR